MADNDILRLRHGIETHMWDDRMNTPIGSEYGDRVHIDTVSSSFNTPHTIHGEALVNGTGVG